LGTVATLAILGVVVVLAFLVWRVWSARAGRRAAVEALLLEFPGFDDRLETRSTTLLFNAKEEMVGIASRKVTKVLPFSIIRKWRTEPIYNSADRRVGWNFIIETGDPQEPIWTIPLQSGPGNAVPNLWMAKFSAHLNG
jgi:hypothetical protein